jgi:hypothetical protein
MPAKSRHLYRGDYPARAKQVRDAASSDPSTKCWRCGEPGRPDDPWQAGHLIDSNPASPLAPEHRSCNARAGAALSNRHRDRRSREW